MDSVRVIDICEVDELINFDRYPVNVVIKELLKDRTTKKNIIFATDDYREDRKSFYDEIKYEDLVRDKKYTIQPRVEKSREEQAIRTKKKAEVFTPSWLCNKMNNYCDTDWFGYANVFNTETDKSWVSNHKKVVFPEGKTWEDYVLSKRIEITCGEAPFLVSRYDAATGEIIDIEDRIGLLDRKIRIIDENVTSQREWKTWVKKAFESTYGYEYQGDNLLIARVNMFNTFYDYYLQMWGEEPSENLMKNIAEIISWNIWQMDGLKGTVPNKNKASKEDEYLGTDGYQMDMFEVMRRMGVMMDEPEEEKEAEDNRITECMIMDWADNNHEIKYNSIKRGY